MLVESFNPTFIAIIFVIAFLWLSLLSFLYFINERRFINLTKGITKNDLRSIIKKIQKDNNLTNKEINSVKKALKSIRLDAENHFQSFSLIRYNPFSDTGGNQSFCLCLLNRHGHGVVISSLHSRDQTRIYAKKIKSGKSPGYTLSKEERAVIQEASRIK